MGPSSPASCTAPALLEWIEANRFTSFTDGFVDKLGVQMVSDLAFVTAGDLIELGFLPVQQRRFQQLLQQPRPVDAPRPLPRSPPYAGVSLQDGHISGNGGPAGGQRRPTIGTPSDQVGARSAQSRVLPARADAPRHAGLGGNGSTGDLLADGDDTDYIRDKLDEGAETASERSDGSGSGAPRRAMKRRRLNRSRARQAADAASTAAGGA